MQGSGGGIRYLRPTVAFDLLGAVCIQMCCFMDNTASNSSGGISLWSYSTVVTISDSTFSENSAKVRSACCHTGPFVLRFCFGIVIDGQRFQKMLGETGDKDPMKACARFSCCMLFDGP